MKYIQLPESVAKLQQDEAGYYFFDFNDKRYLLKDIVAQAKNDCYSDPDHGLELTVTDNCPKKDTLYAEYLPAANKPSTWCVLYKGSDKAADIQQQLRQRSSWFLDTPLSSSRRTEVDAARVEQKEDRYQKGPKSQ